MTAGTAVLDRRAWHETVMGMPVSVHVRGERVDGDVPAAVAALYAELRAVDAVFSTYREDSEISRLARGELRRRDCSSDVREVLALCGLARRRTAGAFDAHRRLPDGGTALDPSGLVKGWATERAARHLARLPGLDWYVCAGGDVVGHVASDARPAWRVGVEDPADRDLLVAVLPLRDGGVATSGTAARGDHVWDPATGRPVRSQLASVTVAGPSLLWADVLATALFVRGGEAAPAVAADGYEVLLVERDGTVRRAARR